ncbi:phage tail tape measure protein [Microbacterium luteum]|uniref:phage tail tape measure protein n=1 Tax=Microbacterium luteum TaxID=2782167 RepID=UPI0030139B17
MDIGTLVGYLELDTSKFEEGAKGAGAKIPGWMAAAGALAATAAAAAFGAAFANAVNVEAGNQKVAAQLGLTEEESRRAGDAAAAAYQAGWGESMEGVQATTAGVISSIRGMREASVEELGGIVSGVQMLSDSFGIEADRISQVVGQMLSTGLASSAEEGLDLLTASLQKVPAAVREDVMDAVDEYGPFFQQIGLSGEEAMGALVSASEKGMYGIDKTGDAIKELSIRSTDMSATSVAAYEAMGLNAEEMAAKILAGGETGAEGFQQIVDGLLGIEDPVAQSQAALALFGTPLEDLGTNEIPGFLASLSDMEGGLGDVGGAMQAMSDTAGDSVAAKWEQVQRSFEGVVTTVAGALLPALVPLLDWAAENPALLGAVAAAVGAMAVAWGIYTVAQWAANAAILANPITWIVLAIGALIAALVLLVANWDTVVAWISEVWGGFVSWLTEVTEGIAAWWNDLWAGFGAWVTSVWEGFVGFISDTWSNFVLGLQIIGDALASWWNDLWAGVGQFISDTWNGFIGLVRGIFQGYISWVMSVASGFVNGWNSIWSRVGRIISDVWNNVVSFFQGIPGAITGLLSGAGQWLYSIGRDIIQGLWNGLKSIWASVSAWFEDTFGGIIDTVAGIFGIASPSKVMRQMGVWVGEGFIQGLDHMTPSVETAMSDMARVPDTASEFIARYPVSEGRGDTFVYNAAENQSLDSEEALFEALGSPRSPFGGK